jgi:hypothetical protein
MAFMVNAWRWSPRPAVLVTAVAALLLLAGWLPAQRTAHADMFFSEDDPIVTINDVSTSIWVGVAPEGVPHVLGCAVVVVVVPKGTQAQIASVGHQNFCEQPYVISADEVASLGGLVPADHGDLEHAAALAHGAHKVVVVAAVMAEGSYPTRLRTSSAPEHRLGRTNSAMVISFPLKVR